MGFTVRWDSDRCGALGGIQLDRNLDHFRQDLESCKVQFDHEAEQEIRGRRTAALGDLQRLLELQKDALTDHWETYKKGNTHLRVDLKQFPPL